MADRELLPLDHFAALLKPLQALGLASAYRDEIVREDELRIKLTQSLPIWSQWLSLPSKSKAERADVEKGILRPPAGPALRMNSEFVQEALLLSDQLDLSERLSATLLSQAVSSVTSQQVDALSTSDQAAPGTAAERAILVYFQFKQDGLAALQLVVQSCWDEATPDHLRRILSSCVEDLLASTQADKPQQPAPAPLGSFGTAKPPPPNASGSKSWISRGLLEMATQAELAKAIHASSGQPKPGFSYEINALRIQAHHASRRAIASTIYWLSHAHQLEIEDLMQILSWLKSADEQDEATLFLSMAVMAHFDASAFHSLDVNRPDELVQRGPEALALSAAAISKVNALFASVSADRPASQWSSAHLKAALQLAWTLWLTQHAHSRALQPQDLRLSSTDIENALYESITEGAFDFLRETTLRWVQTSTSWQGYDELVRSTSAPPLLGLVAVETGSVRLSSSRGAPALDRTLESKSTLASDLAAFRPAVLYQLDVLLASLITSMSPLLRKLKHREEDRVYASVQEGPGQQSSASSMRSTRRRNTREDPKAPAAPPRKDLESLFLLVSTLYAGRQDASLVFWREQLSAAGHEYADNRLPAFLRWAAEVRTPGLIRAFFGMLASLSDGPESATHAYEFLASRAGGPGNLCSWSSLFGALNFYATSLQQHYTSNSYGADGAGDIPPEEVELLKSFVRLLRCIVQSSALARASLYEDQSYKPIATLLSLAVWPIPLDLKAALLDAVAAFARYDGTTTSIEIARQIWQSLEQYQILVTAPQKNQLNRNTLDSGGILSELEDVEVPGETYPHTTAFVNLMSCLIPSPAHAADDRQTASTALITLPDLARQRRLIPNMQPYLRFVVEEVLLKLRDRRYKYPIEQWHLADLCLTFVDRAIASLDAQKYLQAGTFSTSNIHNLTSNPGFELLLQLLSGADLLREICIVASAGFDAVQSSKIPSFLASVRRSLSILLRASELQYTFVEVVLPTLAEMPDLSTDLFKRIRSAVTIDEHLLYSSDVVVAIASLVGTDKNHQIPLNAVNLLSIIAQSPPFSEVDRFRNLYRNKMNRLVGLIESSAETLRIVAGFAACIDASIDRLDDQGSGLRTDDPEAMSQGRATDLTRTAALDLLLTNTQINTAAPNLAHLLLGIDVRSKAEELIIEDAPGKRTSLQAVLDLLDGPVTASDCAVAERAYHLVRQLGGHDYTGVAVRRYLRTQKHFYLDHLARTPFLPPLDDGRDAGTLKLTSGLTIMTTADAITSTLHGQAWMLEAIALEINALAAEQRASQLEQFLELLFVGEQIADQSAEDQVDADIEQPTPRLLEIFFSLDFTFTRQQPASAPDLVHFAEINFAACLQVNAHGCQVYDLIAVTELLAQGRQTMQHQGKLASPQQQASVRDETKDILEALSRDNEQREIRHARLHALQAWRQVLDIALARCLDILPATSVSQLLLNLLVLVLPPLRAEDTEHAIAELLASAGVMIITSLRGLTASEIAGVGEHSLLAATEKLQSILRSVAQAIITPGSTSGVRGNLCVLLLNLLRMGHAIAQTEIAKAPTTTYELNVGADPSYDAMSAVGTDSGRVRATIDASNSQIILSIADRLLPVLCRDALLGSEIWQTVTYMTLDAIVQLNGDMKSQMRLIGIIAKQGYLRSICSSLQDAETRIEDVLSQDPETLNPLYVYEAKVSCLMRIAAARSGAETLLDSQLFTALGACTFLRSPPESDPEGMDIESYIPSPNERYHQLLLPALQLVVLTISSVSDDSVAAARQALQFAIAQSDGLIACLHAVIQAPSLIGLQETRLIAQLMCGAVAVASDDDLASPTSLGGIHSALLGIFSGLHGKQQWLSTVEPTSETEREQDSQTLPGLHGGVRAFSEAVEHAGEAATGSLLSYFTAYSRKSGSTRFRPVWQAVFNEQAASRGAGSLPTLYNAFTMMQELAGQLLTKIEDCRELQFQLENLFDVNTGDFEAQFGVVLDSSRDGRLSDNQKTRLLSSLIDASRRRARAILTAVETSLLLIWRHLNFYTEEHRHQLLGASGRPNAATLSTEYRPVVRMTNNIDINQLRRETSEHLRPCCSQLSDTSLDAEIFGKEARSHDVLLGSLVRSLAEALEPNDGLAPR
ncbi:uncharacterized protein L969DRAFT_105492 [Mixia osmundae IAM 14324]|uniref:Uncharacterized protein n=1 Tax=Mixia osmundae (strain CBS 9802 / IAM 14324 / JCM 22182 / KY 12970) TaxID=764103 RepID=G7E257_MIXOS|nr:uncharacterized protein L969DRAFT_105492 [Mixia osmundae IAM 14324]KEI36789.1 hypothetical protein L969DRAFT_105492 [Mixia osmundae IAM 14324]GAA96917.1 hypothetical protein E5Q_03591 [Mixia osmundae IAM 14324]